MVKQSPSRHTPRMIGRMIGTGLTRARLLATATLLATLVGCGGESNEPGPTEPTGTQGLMDLEVDLAAERQFFDFPFPSDLRLSAEGTPVLDGFINDEANPLVEGLISIAEERPGWPTVPVGYFRFSTALSPLVLGETIVPGPEAPVLLIDVDPDSPTWGEALPTIATTPPADAYVPEGLLAIATERGIVLHPERSYAFVVTHNLLDAEGAPVTASATMRTLREGGTPDGALGGEAQSLYAPLWPALEQAGVDAERVVAATVFTTGDVVAELAALGDAVRDAYDVTIDGLQVDPDDGADHPRFCELVGQVTFPQFQTGTPPFDSEGTFVFGDDGLPVEQRTEDAPIVITLPNEPMPAGGYPLVMYFHGSGGLAGQVVDRGTVLFEGGAPTKGEGPAHVLAAHGFATVGSAHPVNPERLPGATDIAYLNLDNLKAFRDTFRQGVLEQRLYLDALLELEIDPTTVEDCAGLSLPAGETSYHFADAPVMATGQSMGGMYTNLIGATEPRIEAVVPTGAGGFWSYFILETTLVGGKVLIPIVLGSDPELTHLHPGMSLLETAWESAEPMVFMPRLARRPLPDHPHRPIYEPVGKGDSFFPIQLYDAIALAYGHQQAGKEVWPGMQEQLSLAGLDGFVDYPVTDNLQSESGSAFTGVVVQYEGDGIYDPHAIYAQLDEVKHQYGCFFETFFATGVATVPAPAALGTACD